MEFARLSLFVGDSLVSQEEGPYKVLRSSRSFEIENTKLVDFDYVITTPKKESRFYRNDSLVCYQDDFKLIVYEGEYNYEFNK